MNTTKKVITGVICACVLGVGYWLADSMFITEYQKIQAETKTLATRAEAFARSAKGSREIKVGLRDAAKTMLGGEKNIVEHRLRGMLSELAEQSGLQEVVVTHGRPRAEGNPADDRSAKLPRSVRQRLGDQVDFAVIRGRVQGLGTLEQVLGTLAKLRAQPWIHRVEGFTISPKGRGGAVFELKADYATVFAPDLLKAEDAAPSLVEAASSDTESLSALVTRAPFRFAEPPVEPPKPKPTAVAEKPARPASPPPPPYDKWRVTGVLESVGGEDDWVEVILARIDTGETKVLGIGQVVLGATLMRASGEQAWFERGGKTVVVRAGQTLDRARPVESVHSGLAG